MKGATAEPLVRITRPPNTTIITRIGSSQNFLRTRMKRQSSASKSIQFPSKLIAHALRRRPPRIAHDPVTIAIRLAPEPQEFRAGYAQNQADWPDRQVENQPHDDRVDDVVQQQAEPEPDDIERPQD